MPDAEELRPLIPIIQERLPTLASAGDLVGFLWQDGRPGRRRRAGAEALGSRPRIDGAARGARDDLRLRRAIDFEADELEPPMRALAEARGWKAGDLFMAVRVAVTGRTATPPLFDSLVALGRDRVLARIDAAIDTLERSEDAA